MVRALEAVADRDLAGGEVDQAPGNEERADAARAALVERDRGLVDAVEAADAGADEDAGRALVLVGRRVPAGVVERLVGGGHRVDDEVVDLALLLRLHPVVGIELAFGAGRRAAPGRRSGTAGRRPGSRRCGATPLLPARRLRPGGLDAAAERRDHARGR